MTIHIADIASYQGALTLAQLRAAGFTGINVKSSHALGIKSVHPLADQYVSEARAAGMTVGTFHWLDGSASGVEQAEHAFTQMLAVCSGNVANVAHTVDCEDTTRPATQTIYRDYCAVMSSLLKRAIATYTGDWWWTDHARLWQPSAFSPWLWAAPSRGYLTGYPGDTSGDWAAGYGQWSELAVMQYRVAPVAGINVSMSAIRSPEIWAAMRGAANMAWVNIPASTSLLEEVNAVGSPNRNKAQDGTIGDAAHEQEPSDHNPDETGQVEDEWDSDSINEVHARDIDARGPWAPGWSMERIVQLVVARCRGGQERRLRYVIFNGRIWSEASNWQPRTYTGGDQHREHSHWSFHYGSGAAPANPEQVTSAWGIRAAYEGEEVSAEDVVDGLNTKVPYTIARIKDRGWGQLSVQGKLDYLLEAVVASGSLDVDGDGDLDNLSIPARMDRLEAMLVQLLNAAGIQPAHTAPKQ